MKKLFTLMALLLATLAAQAATYYGFKIGGVSVNSDNYQNVTGSNIKSGTVVYNPTSNTVTLTDVTISRTGSDNRAIYNESNSGLTVRLVGNNNLSATDAAPVRIEKTTTITVASNGTTHITGGSEGGIYISGAYKLTINGPGSLFVQADQKGGIEGSSAANTVEFSNVHASIFGGGGCLLDIYGVTFKANSYVHLYGAVQNVKNVDIMNFEGKEVIQSPSNALFNPSSKSVAYYDYNTNSFGNNVTEGVRIDDTGVVALINGTNFPDANFRDFLMKKFQKQYITTADVAATTVLDNLRNCTNLQGIGFFTALEKLYCVQNSLTSLDLSSCPALKTLECYNNKLTSLDLRQNTNLEEVVCNGNQLTTLYLPQTSTLTHLTCNNNNLTSLDVSKNPELTTLKCSSNQLTTLNLSNNKKLTDFTPHSNNISGTGATQFVNNLPNRLDNPISFLFAFNLSNDNELTVEQAQIAHAKGWHTKINATWNGISETVDYYGVVDVNATNFPDANFRNVVSSYDTSFEDGKLDQHERAKVTQMNVGNRNISSLQGIKYFTELTSLTVNQNNLTTLDLSQNTKLTFLSCPNNRLTTLNVAECTELQTLLCGANQLSQLDLTPNKALTKLSCEANKLTSLKVCTEAFPAGVSSNFYVFNNQLGREAVDQFIGKLDNRPTRKSYYIFTTGGNDQKMTETQVQHSRAKGWWPLLNQNGILSDYGGVIEYPITIAGTQVTGDNNNGITGEGITGTITYDPDANVLTLNNASITTAANNAIRVEAALPGLNIKLVGENAITMTNPNKIAINFLNSDGAVIEGPGKLHFNNASAAIYLSSGSGTGDHRATIRNCEISANDPTTYGPSGTSIQEDDGDANLTIENATVRLARGNISCGYDLQLVDCYISKPVGGQVVRGSVCAAGSNSYFIGEIEILPGASFVIGDVNGDKNVDISDLNIIANIILGADDPANYGQRAYINDDSVVDIADLNIITDIILGK